MANGVERESELVVMFSEEELSEMSGVRRCLNYIEVTCGCTSHRYGDAVGRLRVFQNGDLEITCECTPGCQEESKVDDGELFIVFPVTQFMCKQRLVFDLQVLFFVFDRVALWDDVALAIYFMRFLYIFFFFVLLECKDEPGNSQTLNLNSDEQACVRFDKFGLCISWSACLFIFMMQHFELGLMTELDENLRHLDVLTSKVSERITYLELSLFHHSSVYNKLTPAAFEKHSGRETARKWKNNVWVIVNEEKVPLFKTVLLKYYNQASKNANGSHRSHNGRACHRDEFIRCTRCNKDRRFRLRTKEECRIHHDALADSNWKCSDLPYDKTWYGGGRLSWFSTWNREFHAMMMKNEQVAGCTGAAPGLQHARVALLVCVLDVKSAVSQIAAARLVSTLR
uniref:Protein ULTRAPETALA 1 n=1 Tax=Quercus lobata TaxID=97700 RepID=A0A7N2MS40_QUELO